jgi:hypothetical protein
MKASRGVARSGVAASRARDSRAGSRPAIVLACATVLLLMLVPLIAGADVQGLIPPPTDLPATVAPSVLPSPDVPLKVGEQVDDVVRGITAPPQSPPPEGGGQPGKDPPGHDRGGRGGGDGSGAIPGRRPDGGGDTGWLPVASPLPTGRTGGDAPTHEVELPAVAPRTVWRGVSPGLATLATRARSLVAPLAAPMGLGLVAAMLLGIATRGPGVITKLNEELESADGRQVWRL